ncbi:MAG: cytochrome c, partial [Hyphomicrobiales bacterium]|nr:cytochrome c [Hyphomicrobiales bacterium]
MMRRFFTATILAAALIAMAAGLASAQNNRPDPVNGLRLATMWCSACHVVNPVQDTALADAPSFDGIANRQSWSPQRLTNFLTSPHATMPTQGLGRKQIADIVAY